MVEQRRSKRFDVKLPVQILKSGMRPITGAGETRNMSSGGVLFTSDIKVDPGEPLEYVIRLANSGEVDLHCLGKVVRVEAPESESGDRPAGLAVTLERYEFVRHN